VIDFEIAKYGSVCESLLTNVQPADLGPGKPNRDFHDQLVELDAAALFSGQPIADRDMAACCESGLWLLHGYLDESHRISQEIHTPTGSYWHGIMHRREPDFSNAKYWFRKAGKQPIFAPLYEAVCEIAAKQTDPALSSLVDQGRWEPAAFVDVCEAIAGGRLTNKPLCEAVAFAEWQLLFDDCFRSAVGA